jgi:hypothetical protein
MSDLVKLFDEVLLAARKDKPFMPGLYHAILNPAGPNFEQWRYVLGTHREVPLESPRPFTAELEGEGKVECYRLDFWALALGQKARLLGFIANKSGVTIGEVEREIKNRGFPIRASDVILEISTRAVL